MNKTGLAARMRGWMKAQKRPFSPAAVCDGLNVPLGKERNRLRNAIPDFLQRGEIQRVRTGFYRYNPAWRRNDSSPERDRIVKAMYVSVTEFTSADIARLSDARLNYVQKVLRKLSRSGHLQMVGERPPEGSGGIECFYRVTNRQRLRKELMP